jgi:hypothetical protein
LRPHPGHLMRRGLVGYGCGLKNGSEKLDRSSILETPHTSNIARHSTSTPSLPRCVLLRTDVNNSHAVFEGLSNGGSRFVNPSEHPNGGSLPAFSVRVGYVRTFIWVHAKALARFLEEVGLHFSPQYEHDVVPILQRFSAIQTHFRESRDRLEPRERREIKLFVIDLLLDEAVFSGVDKSRPRLLSPAIRSSMRSHKAAIDLDSLQRALGFPNFSRPIFDFTDHSDRSEVHQRSSDCPPICAHHNSRGEPNILCSCFQMEADHGDQKNIWASINDEKDNADPRSLKLVKFGRTFTRASRLWSSIGSPM